MMPELSNRRDWMRRAAAGAAAGGLLHGAQRNRPAVETDGLTAYQDGGKIVVRRNNKTLTAYRANTDQRFPYFFPVAGPVTGASLTTESALPYPHHRSLWFACDKVNGVDYWHDRPLDQGQIRSTDLEFEQLSENAVKIRNRCEWVHPTAASPFTDEREFTIMTASDRVWMIDASIRLTARGEVEIAKSNHSLYSMRVAPEITPLGGGRLVNSEGGSAAEGTFGKPAAWCGFYGKRAGGIVEGIAMMEHPKNPWHPSPWFTRDYGFASPTPLNFVKEPVRLATGESLRLRYRVVLFAGDPASAGLDRIHQQWSKAASDG